MAACPDLGIAAIWQCDRICPGMPMTETAAEFVREGNALMAAG
ncbi:MAG: hypothetical protein ACI82N_001447, partial [Maricaulis sp.]